MADEDMNISTFLESFPTYRLYKQRAPHGGLWVFSSQDKADHGTLIDKIQSAFHKVRHFSTLIVQFWAPVTSDGRRLLSTSGQPFAITGLDYEPDFDPDFDPGYDLGKYRLRSVEYGYNIHVNNKVIIEDTNEQYEEHRPKIIISGPTASSFLNRLPELLLRDTSDHQKSPLVCYAFEKCGLRASYMMPICCPSQSSSCIGVVECSLEWTGCLNIYDQMSRVLEEVGLSLFNVQEHIPYKTIKSLKPARGEIEEALKIVCLSHNIGLAQVWIAYENENQVPFPFSSENTQTKRLLGLKLTGYAVDEDSEGYRQSYKRYYDSCDQVTLQMGEEPVLKTLQDHEPRFCSFIARLGTDKLLAWASLYGGRIETSALAICLRSIDTGDFDYAFEFVWNYNAHSVILLEDLLLTLKRCLPRFKYASGAELGDELSVIDVGNSTKCEARNFKIFQEHRSSPIPEAVKKGKKSTVIVYEAPSKEKRDTKEIELSQEDIEQQHGKTMKEAAAILGVSLSTLEPKHKDFTMSGWQGPTLPKTRTDIIYNNPSKQNHTNVKDNAAIQDHSPVNGNENTLIIKAKFVDDIIKLHLCISEATFSFVESEIGKKFKLALGTYKIRYVDEDKEWILMTSDQDMSDCIKSSRNGDRTVVRLLVLLNN